MKVYSEAQVQSVEVYTGEGRVKVNELHSSTLMKEGLRSASCIQVHQWGKG